MPTHYRGSTEERTSLDAYIKLMRAAESVTARLEPLMRGADLTVGQFGALEALLHLGPSASAISAASSCGAAATPPWWSATSRGAGSCAARGGPTTGGSSRSRSPTRAAD
jgi:hypothetical protein